MSPEPTYDKDTDVYRHIYRGHPSASAVTNADGVTVFFEPRYAHVVPVLLLLALLAFRPSGLAGRTEQIARV